ncbi:MAG: translocation/assembly module TamB domain-containing protein [Cyanobacteria bacterium P01_G01_bin.19]
MTTINQPPNQEPEKDNFLQRLVKKLKPSPKKAAGGAIVIVALGGLGYWGVNVLVKKRLPPFLENQIGKFIERPIELGEVKGFSLGGIEFGKTVIPATATDPDKVEVEGVKVGFNVLPVLFRRTLPLEVTLTQPNIYLEQEQNGEWVNLDFLASEPNQEPKDPLLYFDVDVEVESADITAVPYEQQPLQARVDGGGRFNQKTGFVDYDLDAGVESAKASITGETELETGTTDTKLAIKDLALTEISPLLPVPIEIESGNLNADLDINIPSWAEITSANVKGTLNLSRTTGVATDFDTPISAESQLGFGGRNAQIESTQASFGDITAQVDGNINLDSGYDVEAIVLPFQIASLPSEFTQQLPVSVTGEVEARVKLAGAIKEPQLTGSINNTQTLTVDKTPFEQVDADFTADLSQVVLENIQINPLAGGSITAEGNIKTNISQSLSRDKAIDLNTMPVALQFNADLPTQALISPYYQLPEQVAIGDLDARGEVRGTIGDPRADVRWNIAQASTNNTENITGRGQLTFSDRQLILQDTQVTYGDGRANVVADADLETKQWQANVNADALNLTPFLSQVDNPNLDLNRPVEIKTAKIDLNGSLDNLSPEAIQANADVNLNVDGGDVTVDSRLANGNVQAQAITSNIPLDNFVTSLPVSARLQSGTINASGKLNQLLAIPQNGDLNSLSADADLDLDVDGEAIAVNGRLNNGIVRANANTSQIDINRVIPNLPVPASVRNSKITASGELKQLLAFGKDPNLSTVDARVDADLDVASGTVKAIASLRENQWQANVDANNISSRLLLNEFAPKNLASVEVENIDAKANLTGDINPVLNNELNIPISVNQLAINSGVQSVNARGNLTLSDITNNLDVANTDLYLDANIDFDRLPIDAVLAATTQNNSLVAENVNIQGKAFFNGQFEGKQLISAPGNPENLNLTGDLRLQDFAFNNIAFDSEMTGDVIVRPGTEIVLNLQGQKDVIAARAVPCNDSNCKLPYLPTNLELRQGEDTTQPVIATGNRDGDKFSLAINNFPLALLNIAPAKPAGIEGALAGKTTGNVDLDLYTLAARGNIDIDNPGVGYITANRLDADFNYDPAQNVAEITSSSLDFGDSKYSLNAALDLQSGKMDGRLNIPEAYIQDVLTTFRWFTIEDVTDLFDIPDYAEPAAVKPAPEKDLVDRTIARKLNQLRQVNQQIQANAAAKEAVSIPSELDITGRYEGEIIIGGTIQTPQADFKVEGNDWEWQPIEAYPNIVPPLGLVIEESQFISIPRLLIDGELQGTEVNLAEAELQVEEAAMSLRGKLSPDKLDTTFAIANLTVDNIANFVEIPVDIAGEINTVGTITGSTQQPKLEGKIAFTEGAFNGNILPAEIAGNYDYDGTRLGFNTTAPDAIRIEAEVPYPIIPGKSDRAYAKADLDKEAFVFLSALSQNYLNWLGGEGNANLQAEARLDLEREGIIYDLDADGVVNLEDANISLETPFFDEQFIGTGKINLNNQIVDVETLNGTFAEKDLSVTGKLPLLKVVENLEDPLTVELPEGDINIDKLYQGGVEGRVLVTGAALEPVIGGEVNLKDGEVSIPQTNAPEEDAVQIAKSKVTPNVSSANTKALNKASSSTDASSSFVTTLDDFQINIEEFKLSQIALYEFQLDGGLTLNGTADTPSNIRPEGSIELTKANVNLFSTNFELARNLENTIVFTPEAGVLNPSLNVVLRTKVEDVQGSDELNTLRSVESNSNEIDDPISNIDNTNTIRISLNINGEAADILPNLANSSTDCNIRPSDAPLVENNQYYSAAELNRLTECFNDGALAQTNGRNLVDSSAVNLTSTPSLEQGEIIGLLSERFAAFARETVSGSGGEGLSQSRLFDLGVQRFVVAPLVDSTLNRVEDTTVRWGRAVGLDYFTVYPNVEGTYEISNKSSLRFTYDYNLLANVSNVFDDETTTSNEIRVQYQLNF